MHWSIGKDIWDGLGLEFVAGASAGALCMGWNVRGERVLVQVCAGAWRGCDVMTTAFTAVRYELLYGSAMQR